MRRKITNETWEQIKTGYAAGINLREIARKMNIPEGTVLAHAKRHGWTQQIQGRHLVSPCDDISRFFLQILGRRECLFEDADKIIQCVRIPKEV
jgi:hypothetical protein